MADDDDGLRETPNILEGLDRILRITRVEVTLRLGTWDREVRRRFTDLPQLDSLGSTFHESPE